MGNLWPERFEETKRRTAKEILEEQAQYLPKLTGDLVYAWIESESTAEGFLRGIKGNFVFSFGIKGKFVPKYRYIIFYFAHDLDIYPVDIALLDEKICQELKIEQKPEVNNEDEFIKLLERIFHSKRLGDIIGSMMTLSK
jgi:hypothetical protein